MKIYRGITVVRQNKCRRLHFCPPSPAQPGPFGFYWVRVAAAAWGWQSSISIVG